VDELANYLRTLLSDADLRRQFGQRAYETAKDLWGEPAYVAAFAEMVRAAVRQAQ
jgi:hypothetical protein